MKAEVTDVSPHFAGFCSSAPGRGNILPHHLNTLAFRTPLKVFTSTASFCITGHEQISEDTNVNASVSTRASATNSFALNLFRRTKKMF